MYVGHTNVIESSDLLDLRNRRVELVGRVDRVEEPGVSFLCYYRTVNSLGHVLACILEQDLGSAGLRVSILKCGCTTKVTYMKADEVGDTEVSTVPN